MHRVGGWFQPRKLHANASTQSLNALAESQNLEAAMAAATLIMNDDVAGAERGLSQGNSSYHKLGMGVILFLRATLGFEQDVIKEASERLADAETSASHDLYKAQRSEKYNHDSLYAPGAEFALCNALAQIMGAVVAVLNESLTDAIRAFYKLRKAYITLNGLNDEEDKALKAKGFNSVVTSKQPSLESLKHSAISPEAQRSVIPGLNAYPGPTSTQIHSPSKLRDSENADTEQKPPEDEDNDDEFYDANDFRNEKPTNEYTGNLDTDLAGVNSKLSDMSLHAERDPDHLPAPPKVSGRDLRRFSQDPDSTVFQTPIDIFVHSGINLCFGLLLLLISAIPPVFSKLLYVIGFRGDRERGIKMLWQASKFRNINGGMAGLALLGWYNGLVSFCDIVPDANPDDPEDVEGYPGARLEALLAEMRIRYPNSLLWRVEEARMAASHRDLDTALDVLTHTGKSTLKQVEALTVFEKSISALYAHRYQLCADSFIACVDLNSWSRALYYYIAGSAHLAMYRDLKASGGTREEIEKQAKLAEEYFKIAPTHTGKKRIMARQLPFDVFVARKIQKWTARSVTWNCSFVDAIGVSPNEEMAFFWNGYKRMSSAQLEHSLANLAWSENTTLNPHWPSEELDEHAILAVLRSSILRNLRRHDEAKALLRKEVLAHDKSLFKGHLKDEWTAPTAHYEMGVNLWMERTGYAREYGAEIPEVVSRDRRASLVRQWSNVSILDKQSRPQTLSRAGTRNSTTPIPDLDVIGDAKLVAECKEWIDKARGWESYDLDTRIGLKITTAADALRKWEARFGATGKK